MCRQLFESCGEWIAVPDVLPVVGLPGTCP